MCCSECCTCDCCDRNDSNSSMSLQEFLDSNNHPDGSKLFEFLQFFKNINDPVVHDKSWYTQERLMAKFHELKINV